MDESMQQQTPAVPQQTQPSILNDLCDMIETILVSIFVVLLLFTFVLKVATVEGDSMKQTLFDGDRLIVSSINYTPKQGDVVIINAWNAYIFDKNNEVKQGVGLGKRIVKRIIATAGQEVNIDFETGAVSVDGQVLTETYINSPTTRDEGAFAYPITIPEGYAFVLGDNRGVSKDSRHPSVGLIPEKDIVGKVVLRVYPFSSFGTIS